MILKRLVLPAIVLYAGLVGVGLALAHPLRRIVAGEDGVDRDLAAHRGPPWITVTKVLSLLADTPAIVTAVLVAAIALWLTYRRWREPLLVVLAVALQAVVFLLTTLVIDRPRPTVPKLDHAPPTSSFPSGHTGAAAALAGGLALIVIWNLRHVVLRALVVVVLALFPIAVAVSRLYRGMHHPTDVLFGAINGLVCVVIAAAVAGAMPTRERSKP